MQESFLDEAFRETVRPLLARKDRLWRNCCGNDCDPCATTLARVVDRTRELMEASAERATSPNAENLSEPAD